MLAILLAHAVATAVAPLLVYRWGRLAFYPLALVPLGSLIWVALNWPGGDRADAPCDVAWVPELSMDITLRFDALRRDHERAGARHRRAGAVLLRRATSTTTTATPRSGCPASPPSSSRSPGAMFGLVVSDNMLVLYVFWELTTVLSFLLVGHYAERATSRRAATQALLVTTAAGWPCWSASSSWATLAGTYLLSELIAAPADRAGGVASAWC